MKMNINKIIVLLFEFSLAFLFLQHDLFPSELTFVSLMLTIAIGIFIVIKSNRLFLNPFIVTYIIFLIYITIDTCFRGNLEENINILIMYCMQLISSLCIYNYLIKTRKIDNFLKIYIIIGIISLIIMFILLGEKAISTRLGHNGAGKTISYYLFNIPIYKSSNGTANFCAIATFFLLYYAEIKGKKNYYIPIIILTIGVILCGSRKGILTYLIYIVYTYFFMKKGITKKKILLFFFVPIIIYVTIMKVPVVYNSIGQRIESIVLNLFNVSNDLDQNSYAKRQQLKQEALEWIDKKPITGYGLKSFSNKTGYGTENNILQIMVEFGVIGTLIYYSFIPFLIYEILKLKNKSVIAKIMGVIVITILIQDYGSVTYSWQHMTMWYSVFWAVIRLERNENISTRITEKEGGNIINYEK